MAFVGLASLAAMGLAMPAGEGEEPTAPLVQDAASVLVAGGTIEDFFTLLSKQFKQPTDFKEACIRDNECLALVGALLLTIAFPMLEADIAAEDQHVAMQLLYIAASSAAVMLSLLGTTLAVRTILLVNSGSAEQTLGMLKELTQGRRERTGGEHAHPYNFIRLSLAAMLASCAIRVYVTYGIGGAAVVCSAIALTFAYFVREEYNFDVALLKTWNENRHSV